MLPEAGKGFRAGTDAARRRCHNLRSVLLSFLVFMILAAVGATLASAQQPSGSVADIKNGDATNTDIKNDGKNDVKNGDPVKAVEQLAEQNDKLAQQNRGLEQQNRALEEQNRVLEQQIRALVKQANPAGLSTSDPAPAPAASKQPPAPATDSPDLADAATVLVDQSSGQSGGQGQSGGDDKFKLPQASEGNSAIFGEFNPGRGFTVAQGEFGKLNLSGYMAVRYLNQLPASQSAVDHLGRPIAVTPRQDFQFHRVMLFSQGWLFSQNFQYSTFLWTVQDTNQVAVGGALYYKFGKFMTLGAGWNAYPGTLSLQGSHPYWESYDRVMADEFFRPYFSQGVFAQGNLLPSLEYRWMIGNNNSNLDVPAVKLDRDLSGGFAITWLPTTHEFGPRGAFGDYEMHEKVATRFNLAYTYSPEDRQSAIGTPASNTTLRLSDSLNVFDTGALANGVTVEHARYQMLSLGAGMKYRGFWLQGEGYGRKLDKFVADGPLPLGTVRDFGFYVQAAHMIVPKHGEIYGATSYIFGQFNHPKEFIVGGNYYPWDTRNIRLNLHLINVGQSPVSSTFGFYNGKISGQVVAVGLTALY